ncbi:hypothetical protein V1477_001672 [Vespula maculifrons]|uniref:Uncharacterized protein n=1 Tax=Vespula maculifrons TaxID=7453 RepID=A0ABD2CYF7_VESMC
MLPECQVGRYDEARRETSFLLYGRTETLEPVNNSETGDAIPSVEPRSLTRAEYSPEAATCSSSLARRCPIYK